MSDTYVYLYGKDLYINLTNECTNSCDFCIRNNKIGIPGEDLWLTKEPSSADVIAQLEKFPPHDLVFCGYLSGRGNFESGAHRSRQGSTHPEKLPVRTHCQSGIFSGVSCGSG